MISRPRADLVTSQLAASYEADGVVSAPIVSEAEAAEHRAAFEAGEQQLGPLHYIDKVHSVMMSPYKLATHPAVLDIVESLIGPDILLYNSTYIVKEPGSDAFVAWHQDLTYWGLDNDDGQVSMWLALAPATVEAGCMSMIPGSHRQGRRVHTTENSDANQLGLGQRIEDVDEREARPYPLAPGEASFHHGWTLHTSAPNTTTDRRIGLNVQYLTADNRQRGGQVGALLVRGEDRWQHFPADRAPTCDIDTDAVERWRELDTAMKAAFAVDDS